MLRSEYFKAYILKSYLSLPVVTLKRFTKEHLTYCPYKKEIYILYRST